MDFYALRNIFHEKVAKGDLVIRNGKRTDQRIHRPKVAMTFFMRCKYPIEEEVRSVASSSFAPPPVQDEEMMFRIQHDDKFHSSLEGIGLRPLAKREVAQALSQVVERSQGVVVFEGSLLQVAYQETRESVTFSLRDLTNQAVDGKKPLYVTTFLGASQIKRTLVDTSACTNIPLLIG